MSEQLFDSKIWRKDQINNVREDSFGYRPKYILNKNKKQNTDNNYNANNNNGNNLSSSMAMSSNHKKLPFSLQSKPFGLINKKINNNQTNTNNSNIYNNSNNNSNNTKQYIMNHNLPKFIQKKNNENISLLDKIKDKINKEKKETKKNSSNIKQKNNNDKSPINDHIIKKTENKEENKKSKEEVLENKINENIIKNDNNDDEDDILSEEVDEMEESGNNAINSINKINSINVHSNFIKTHYYSGSGFSMNSNNSNSNSSTIKQKCCTEPDEYSYYPKTYQNEPSSGRSNYSGSTNIAQAGSQAVGADNSSNFYGLYGLNTGYGYQIKNSFLSTGANTNNSHNLSGHKVDSSLSNESGQSPHYLKYQRLQYNNSMTNIGKNNTFMFPFTSTITPIDNRHIYTSSFNSNESLFRQPFSLNTKTFTNNFNYSKKEKQVIKLEDVALGKETRTTVMIRNIPIKYTDQVLEKELEQFEGKYDCLYMPFDYENGGNKGYAFLNLKSPYHVLLFYEVFNNKCWMFFDSKKICELNYANFQGIDEIKKHAKNYKGSKKPNFYINTKSDNSANNKIEIPYKYLNLLLQANPKMKYVENKQKNLIIVESFK